MTLSIFMLYQDFIKNCFFYFVMRRDKILNFFEVFCSSLIEWLVINVNCFKCNGSNWLIHIFGIPKNGFLDEESMEFKNLFLKKKKNPFFVLETLFYILLPDIFPDCDAMARNIFPDCTRIHDIRAMITINRICSAVIIFAPLILSSWERIGPKDYNWFAYRIFKTNEKRLIISIFILFHHTIIYFEFYWRKK